MAFTGSIAMALWWEQGAQEDLLLGFDIHLLISFSRCRDLNGGLVRLYSGVQE